MDNEVKQIDLLKERIIYDQLIFGDISVYNKLLNRLLEDSKNIALSIRFPFKDYSLLELPKKYYNWQLRCCVEIYKNLGKENIKSYSENGVSWSKVEGSISNDLKDEIMPMIGVVSEDD